MERIIIHLDLDAFFCSVEEVMNPKLKGKPFAVGGEPGQRGVIASCSYAARKFGIHSAMPTSYALRLYPKLILINPNHRNYIDFSQKFIDIIKSYSAIFEQVSIDEAFLDISSHKLKPMQLAVEIQRILNNELHLPCSLGIATNKLVAKIANDVSKKEHNSISPPNKITIIRPGNEEALLSPLPVRMLIGVGEKTEKRLNNMGVITIGDLAKISLKTLIDSFGKYGNNLYLHSRGIDDSLVHNQHRYKSISRESTFKKDTRDLSIIYKKLDDLSMSVSSRAKHKNKFGNIIKLKLRWDDFVTITKQHTLLSPTNDSRIICTETKYLLMQSLTRRNKIRLIGVGLSGFDSRENKQLSFLNNSDAINKEYVINQVIGDINAKFGVKLIKKGLKR